MSRTVFITGATGFVGRVLLTRLKRSNDATQIRLLVRDASKLSKLPAGFDLIEGDLTRPETYRHALDGVDAVIHLAAQTGKASPKEHERLNRQVTKDLIEAAKQASVDHFIFVSTIAAGYSDKAYYPYAFAKAASEADLRDSGLTHTILRPTLVFGPGSPVLGSLMTLANLPIAPLPSRGPAVDVQPIDVADVARAIIAVLDKKPNTNETIELGGPDRLTMRALLEQLALFKSGKRPRVLGLPLRLIQWPLALMEPIARPFIPFTAGQFAVFGNTSAAQPNWLTSELSPHMIDFREMLVRASHEDQDASNDDPSQLESTTSEARAKAEAQTLARHMCGRLPSEALTAHYTKAIKKCGLDSEGSRFDRLTLSLARRGGPLLSMVDSYCGLFHRRGVLRRRQVLLASLLENEGATHAAFDDAYSKGPTRAFLRLAGSGIASGLFTLTGILALLPARLICALPGR